MKNINRSSVIFILVLLLIHCQSCKKSWLDAKPDKALAIPVTIADFQGLLDNTSLFDANDCILDEIGAGDFYIKDVSVGMISQQYLRTAYSWASDIFEDNTSVISDWAYPYQRVFNANVVLEGIEKVVPKNNFEQINWNNVYGAALFYRGFNHYSIAKCFCKVYDKSTAHTDLGIPLRLESDINIPSVRSTVQQTYDQIVNDLKTAYLLLPILGPINNNYRVRPTKTASAAMLARVYLSMSEYDSAYKYADIALSLYNTLMDYNNNPPNINGPTPFTRLNAEVIFDMPAINYNTIFAQNRLIVDSFLYRSFNDNDLRKTGFFRILSGGDTTYKPTYLGSTILFTGLATDEIYLIRAECSARKGDTLSAMQDLNTLMIRRWKKGNFIPFTAQSADDALRKILIERRKELCFRGIRWSDLRRLNKEPQFEVTLKRVVNGNMYLLPPNDPKYVLPIPLGVILLTNMAQNPR